MAKKTRIVTEKDSRSSSGRVERDIGKGGGFIYVGGKVTPNRDPRKKAEVQAGAGIGVRFGGSKQSKKSTKKK